MRRGLGTPLGNLVSSDLLKNRAKAVETRVDDDIYRTVSVSRLLRGYDEIKGLYSYSITVPEPNTV